MKECRRVGTVKPFQYRGRVWEGVDVSFSSFLCAKEKDRKKSIKFIIYEEKNKLEQSY
jgi:hypothetical protein